jgi:hypothetical protein
MAEVSQVKEKCKEGQVLKQVVEGARQEQEARGIR